MKTFKNTAPSPSEPPNPGTRQTILDLLSHVQILAEADGETEMALLIGQAIDRCAQIHVTASYKELLNKPTDDALH